MVVNAIIQICMQPPFFGGQFFYCHRPVGSFLRVEAELKMAALCAMRSFVEAVAERRPVNPGA